MASASITGQVVEEKPALHKAAEGGRLDDFRKLLEEGADIRQPWGPENKLPVHLAARADHIDIVKVIGEVDKRFLVCTDELCCTLAHEAAFGGAWSVFLYLLEDVGVDLQATCDMGFNYAHMAALNDHINILSILTKTGVVHGSELLNACDNVGNTPAHYAALNGAVNALNFLASHTSRFCLYVKGEDGRVAAHFAASGNHVNSLMLIASLASDTLLETDLTDLAEAPLGAACRYEAYDCIQYLVSKRDLSISSSLLPVCADYSLDVKKCLISADFACAAFFLDVEPLPWESEDARLKRYSDLSQLEYAEWNSPLQICAQYDLTDIASCLLQQGLCDVNECDSDGRTALHIAPELGNEEMCRLLLYFGADPNFQSSLGFTPLMEAVLATADNPCLQILISVTDISLTTSEGDNALHLAVTTGNSTMIKLLCQQGNFDLEALNNEGQSALSLAVSSDNSHELSLMLVHFGFDIYGLAYSDCITGLELLKWHVPSAARLAAITHEINSYKDSGSDWWKRSGQNELGHGSFGYVIKAKLKFSGSEIAVKINKIPVKLELKEKQQKLLSACLDLFHPNIVRVFHHAVVNDYLHIFMELVSGGTLRQRQNRNLENRRRLEVSVVCVLTRQLLEALAYLKSRSVLHRDVKPDNILLTDDDVLKLTDFGLAKEVDFMGTYTQTQAGTRCYMAPEAFASYQPESDLPGPPGDLKSRYSYKVDVWSAGCVFFEMLTGLPPFTEDAQPLLNIHKMQQELLQTQVQPAEVQDVLEVFGSAVAVKSADRLDPDLLLLFPFFQATL